MNCARCLAWSAGLALLAPACDQPEAPVRIGAVAPLTGEAAGLGNSAKGGFELAVEQWNARGGVLGRPVKLVIADDQGDPTEGASVVTMLIKQRRVVGLVGPSMTRVTLAGAAIAQAAGVPLVASAATSPKVTEVGDFIFRACTVDVFQGRMGAHFAWHDLKARRAACLFDLGNDYPTGMASGFRAAFLQSGGTVVAFEGHPSGATDFQAHLLRALQAAPDLLYVPDHYRDAALIAGQARELGFRGPILGADGWDSPTLLEAGGDGLDNTFYTTFFCPEDPDPAVQTFVKAYRSRYGRVPDGHATMGYEAAVILLDAIRRAGTTEGRAVRDAIARTDLRLVTGQVSFDAHRNPRQPVVVMEIKGGRPVLRQAGFPAGPSGMPPPVASPRGGRRPPR